MVKRVLLQAIGTVLAASCAAGQGLDAPPSVRVTAKGGVVEGDGSQDAVHGRLLATHTVHLLTGAGPLAVDPSLSLQLLSVADSRCPIGVMCIQPGGILANVSVNEKGENSTVVLSSQFGTPINTTTPRLGYVLRLGTVLPPPARHSSLRVEEEKQAAAVLYDLEVLVTDPVPLQDQLNKARARWSAASAGHGGYSMVERVSCFCPPEMLQPVRMDVDAHGNVTHVGYADPQPAGPPLPSSYSGSYLTVAQLFDLLQDAINRRAATIQVQFDEALGYPRSLYIDMDKMIADEERSITVTDLRLLP